MMKVRQGLRRRRGSRLLIALIGLATYAALLAMLFAVFTPERYDLVAGQVSPITVTASKDVVDSVTTQQMIDEAVAAVPVNYTLDETVQPAVLESLRGDFDALNQIRGWDLGSDGAVDAATLTRARQMLLGADLTAEDIAHLRKFDDVICISTHGYDVHNYDGPGNIKWAEMEIDGRTQYVICNAGGFGATTPPPNGMPVVNVRGESMENAVFETNGYYDIPYRCLVPEKLDNLLVAGRNLSSDVNAQSGSRLILACLNMGEAAGTAMAISLAENIPPRAVDVKALQAELIASGCNIGQNMRAIPGVDPNASFEDRYVNPELVGSNRQRGGYERSLEEVSAPWEKK